MRSKREVVKQFNEIHAAFKRGDVNFRYFKAYTAALEWVLEME
ncbi:MAG: hypothetical protein PHS46_08255 [Candidatus Omnitrophica bacterium]|nr:hypothetical protein [Candidatus Omnitrophota bacterium]